MRRVSLALAFLIFIPLLWLTSTAAAEALSPCSPDGPIYACPSLMAKRLGTIVYPFLLFAPTTASAPATNGYAAGQGLPFVQPLCATWATLDPSPTQSGCLDGNTASGTNTASAGGPWVTFGTGNSDSSDPICPNGPNCASVSSRRSTTTGGWALTSAIANNTSGLTACWLGVFDDPSVTVRIFTQETAANAAGIAWEVGTGSGTLFSTVSSGASAITASKAGLVSGALHLACVTWSAAAGVEACVDGSCSAGVAQASMQALTTKVTVNGTSATATNGGSVRTMGAFYSSTRLTDAQIATLAHAVLADQPFGAVQGRWDAGMAYSGGPQFCERNDNAADGGTWARVGSVVPAGRPCVTGGRVQVENTGTNLTVRSFKPENAAWTSTFAATGGAPVVALSDGGAEFTAPDGTKNVRRIAVPACSGVTGASVTYQDFTATSGSRHVCSGYVRGSFMDGGVALYNYNTPTLAGSETVCSVNQDTWTRCTHSWVQAANTSGRFGFGCQNDATVTGRTALSAINVDVWLWDCKVETSANASSAVVTDSATVNRAASNPSFPGITRQTAQGSAAITLLPATSGAGQDQVFNDGESNGRMLYYSNSATPAIFDGTNVVSLGAWSQTVGVPFRIRSGWQSGIGASVTGGGSTAYGAFDGTLGVAGAGVYLGGAQFSSNSEPGLYGDLCYDSTDGGCQ